jgi:hypothetical protein
MPITEAPTLAEMIASFDPDRHDGEVMVTEPVGVEYCVCQSLQVMQQLIPCQLLQIFAIAQQTESR